jgi:hypothetical protein
MTDILITQQQMKMLHVLAKEAGISHPELSASAKKMFGVTSLKDLDIAQAGTLIDDLLPAHAKMPMPEPKKVAPVYTKFPTRAAMLAPTKPVNPWPEADYRESEPVEDISDEDPELTLPLPKPPELPAPMPPAAADVDPESTMPLHPEKPDEPFEPDSLDDDDAVIITKPLQPAVPRKPPLYVAPARPGTVPVRPPHGGGPAPKPMPTEPRPSFLKPLPDQGYMPVTTGLRMPLAPVAPKQAAAVVENRQTGGFGRLRASVPTATLPEPAAAERPSEFKAQTNKVRVYSDLKPDDIPF